MSEDEACDQVKHILDNIPLAQASRVAQWAADHYAIHLPVFVVTDDE